MALERNVSQSYQIWTKWDRSGRFLCILSIYRSQTAGLPSPQLLFWTVWWIFEISEECHCIGWQLIGQGLDPEVWHMQGAILLCDQSPHGSGTVLNLFSVPHISGEMRGDPWRVGTPSHGTQSTRSRSKHGHKILNHHQKPAHKALATLRGELEISPANYKNGRQNPARYDFLH